MAVRSAPRRRSLRPYRSALCATISAWSPVPAIGSHTITTTVRFSNHQDAGYPGDEVTVTTFEVVNSRLPTQAPSTVPTAVACAPGTNGPSCEYADALYCNGHASVTYWGKCDCGERFNPAWTSQGYCASCATGYAGNNCQHSDAVTCNGGGTALQTGACVCDPDRTGQFCDGVATTAPTTSTPTGAAAITSPPTPQPTTSTPTGAAVITSSPTALPSAVPTAAACASGTNGPSCEYSDAGHCNGRASVTYTGTCDCGERFNPAWTSQGYCASCATGYAGNNCQLSDAVTCNGGGTALQTGACVCDPDRTGQFCDGLATMSTTTADPATMSTTTADPGTAPIGGTNDRALDGEASSGSTTAVLVVVLLLVAAACVGVVLWKRKPRQDETKAAAVADKEQASKTRLFSATNTIYRSGRVKHAPKGMSARPPSP